MRPALTAPSTDVSFLDLFKTESLESNTQPLLVHMRTPAWRIQVWRVRLGARCQECPSHPAAEASELGWAIKAPPEVVREEVTHWLKGRRVRFPREPEQNEPAVPPTSSPENLRRGSPLRGWACSHYPGTSLPSELNGNENWVVLMEDLLPQLHIVTMLFGPCLGHPINKQCGRWLGIFLFC